MHFVLVLTTAAGASKVLQTRGVFLYAQRQLWRAVAIASRLAELFHNPVSRRAKPLKEQPGLRRPYEW